MQWQCQHFLLVGRYTVTNFIGWAVKGYLNRWNSFFSIFWLIRLGKKNLAWHSPNRTRSWRHHWEVEFIRGLARRLLSTVCKLSGSLIEKRPIFPIYTIKDWLADILTSSLNLILETWSLKIHFFHNVGNCPRKAF